MDGNSSRTKHVATLLECSIGMLKILSWNNEVRDLKISLEVDYGLSREETPRRILISTADREEFYCLSGRASVHLQSSSLLSGSCPESWELKEKWERAEENNLCFVPCSHKKVFLLGSISLAHKYFKSDEIIYQENENKRQVYESQKTRTSRIFLGNLSKQLKLSFGAWKRPGGVTKWCIKFKRFVNGVEHFNGVLKNGRVTAQHGEWVEQPLASFVNGPRPSGNILLYSGRVAANEIHLCFCRRCKCGRLPNVVQSWSCTGRVVCRMKN